MAAVQIQIDQAGKPPGTPGQARQDLAVGTNVNLTAVGGVYKQYQWTILSRPLDVVMARRSSCVLATPDQSSTVISPIDLPDTYFVQLAVDSGNGLGASLDDIARITFYAGPTLGGGNQLPARKPAYRETTEHNAPDAIDPLGNPEGWRKAMEYWFAVIARHDQILENAETAYMKVYSTVQNLANAFPAGGSGGYGLIIFKVTGSVFVSQLGVIVKSAFGSNVTGVAFIATDEASGAAQITVQPGGPDMSSAPAGANCMRGQAHNQPAVVVTGGLVSGTPDWATEGNILVPFEMTAPPSTGLYIGFIFDTTSFPQAGSIQGYCQYSALSADGLVIGQ